jgi:hypothetical protein
VFGGSATPSTRLLGVHFEVSFCAQVDKGCTLESVAALSTFGPLARIAGLESDIADEEIYGKVMETISRNSLERLSSHLYI